MFVTTATSVVLAQDDTAKEEAKTEAKEETPTKASPGETIDSDDSGEKKEEYSAATSEEDKIAAAKGHGSYEYFVISNLWLLVCAALVFIMHLGFTTLEAGLTQKKNAVNIIFKNVWILCVGILCYAFWGFNSMYPGDFNNYFAVGSWFGVSLNDVSQHGGYSYPYTWWTDFIFQAMFAATGATIVSGAVAERVKLPTFMVFALLLVGLAYPISGSWKWGEGFLHDMGFYDLAGSTVVHAFGGFAALACAIVLGPRLGKYTDKGIKPIVGHSMPLAAVGVFLLWFGWFGFNAGSVLSADPKAISFVFVTTTLAACAGGVASILASWIVLGKLDVSMALNGILAGLVSITAGADTISPQFAILIGAIGGIVVVFSIIFFDKIRVDDPVGAVSVHGVCGVWGTLAVGIFSFNSAHNFITQLTGTFIISVFAFVFAFVVFSILNIIMGVRVSEHEEMEGLDISEHGASAYNG